MNTKMSEEEKTFMKIAFTFCGGFTLIFISLAGVAKFFDFVEDTIKYHRYQEAVKEYQQCAEKHQKDYHVMIYCGDIPSSTIMI